MKKLLVFIVIFLMTTVYVSAIEPTKFNVKYTNPKESNIDIEIDTNNTEGVGGIDLMLTYDNSKWKIVDNSAKCGIKKSEISAKDGLVRAIWDTTEKTKLPECLLTVSFKKISDNADISDIALTVNEYYDDTVNLNDIPNQVVYTNQKTVSKVKTINKTAVIAIVVLLLVILGFSAFYYYKKKFSKTKH